MSFDEPSESMTVEEALEPKESYEWTEEEVEIIMPLLKDIGIVEDYIKTVIKGWNAKHDRKKKILHNNNLTKGFWIYAMEVLPAIDLPKIDMDKIDIDLAHITMKQMEIRAESIKDDEKAQLREEIARLMEENQKLFERLEHSQKQTQEAMGLTDEDIYKYDEILTLLKWLYDFMSNMEFSFEFIDCPNCHACNKFDRKDIAIPKGHENSVFKPTKEDIERLTKIKEMTKNG